MSAFCLEILIKGVSLEKINKTNIVFIPKTPNPNTLKDFRPISLCSVLYKIVAKTTVNSLQRVLDFYINDANSAFIPGRFITDNIFL